MARGSVKPRPMKDGTVRYRVKWESRGPNGERRHHSATKNTKKEAEKFLAEKLNEVNDGTFVQPTRETVAMFLERWLTSFQADWTEATAYQYRSTVKTRIVPYIGAVSLARLDEITVQEYYAQLIKAGYSPRTVIGAHVILKSALAQAVAWRLVSRNPLDGAKPPAARSAAPEVWTVLEVEQFLLQTASDRLGALWRLGLDSGMRLGEMLALTWRDFDRQRGVVAVRRTLTRTSQGGWKLGDLAKTASSRRSIHVSPSTVTALRAHGARQAERRLASGGAWNDHDLIFDRGDGQWLDPITARREFDRGVADANLPKLTPHGMRHTMATLLLEAGVHPKIVQERLGHKSIQMTLDRYSHVAMTMQRDAALTLERLLTPDARPDRGHTAS